jgi:ketosteroid isomerase-like protein
MNVKILGMMVLVCVTSVSLTSNASAGFLDAFNKLNQTVQQTTYTVENARNTAQRAGAIIPKSNKPKSKPAETSDKIAVKPSGSMTSKDKAAIEKAKRSWVAAFKAEDWDSLVDNYAEDAVLLAPDEQAISGREGIRGYYGSDEDTSKEVFTTVAMGGDSNIVYVQGEFSFTIQSKNEAPTEASGKYMEIWQKQDDGNWLITHDIFNANPAAN